MCDICAFLRQRFYLSSHQPSRDRSRNNRDASERHIKPSTPHNSPQLPLTDAAGMNAGTNKTGDNRVLESEHSPLLRIPPELRLCIYEFALLDSPKVTVSHAEVVGKHHDVIHRLYGEDRTPYPGLPQHHEPVISPCYDASLLSITHPATISAASAPITESYRYSTHQSLLLANKQIREELTSHLKLPKNRQTSIFASFPYGLYILKKTAPHLLGQAQSIHLAGRYVSTTYNPSRAACVGPVTRPEGLLPRDHNGAKHNGEYTPYSAELLGQLIASTFGPDPIYHLRKLEMRIYYEGSDSYSTVWGDDDSPTVVALRNMSHAEVGIEVWRGQKGTGIYLTAKPNSTGERKRVVSTVWRKLEEGRRDQPEAGSWVVDPKWPHWEEEYDMSDGPKGNLFTSVPVNNGAGSSSTA